MQATWRRARLPAGVMVAVDDDDPDEVVITVAEEHASAQLVAALSGAGMVLRGDEWRRVDRAAS